MASYKTHNFIDWDLETAARIREALLDIRVWRRISSAPLMESCGPFDVTNGSLDDTYDALRTWTVTGTVRCQLIARIPNRSFIGVTNCCLFEPKSVIISPSVISRVGSEECLYSPVAAIVTRTKTKLYRLAATSEQGWADWQNSEEDDDLYFNGKYGGIDGGPID
jgi:hypothetical protein